MSKINFINRQNKFKNEKTIKQLKEKFFTKFKSR